jgi:hypothetical protein
MFHVITRETVYETIFHVLSHEKSKFYSSYITLKKNILL